MTVNHRPLAPPPSGETVEVASPGRTAHGAAELDSLAVGAVIYTEVRRVTERHAGMVAIAAVRHPDGWVPTGAPYPVTSESIAELAASWAVLRRPTRRARR